MTEDRDSDGLHPQVAPLIGQYARDLAQTRPTPNLDARIEHLVATRRLAPARTKRRWWPAYAAAAGFAALAAGVGIVIGMWLEHARKVSVANQAATREAAWPPADLTMWPTDSVSFKIPAEYSARGTLVAIDPNSKHSGRRYWIDVVVSNDGIFRIQRIVPAESMHTQGAQDGVAVHRQ